MPLERVAVVIPGRTKPAADVDQVESSPRRLWLALSLLLLLLLPLVVTFEAEVFKAATALGGYHSYRRDNQNQTNWINSSRLINAAKHEMVTLPKAWLTLVANKTTAVTPTGNESIPHCSPTVLNASEIEYPSTNRFYDLLRALPTMPAPVFHHHETALCDDANAQTMAWDYCLPIRGRRDTPYCDGPDRMDLLTGPRARDSTCVASVLHLLLTDVYNEMKEFQVKPALLFGSMLGAVRDGATIPFTEDADIGYQGMYEPAMKRLRQSLRRKGYHMFRANIWRICVAPTHPLATVLYDPSYGDLVVPEIVVPYVDLYKMTRENATHWYIKHMTNKKYRLPNAVFEPYSTVHLNGLSYDTVADPVEFLTQEYGEEYMTPVARPERTSKPKSARVRILQSDALQDGGHRYAEGEEEEEEEEEEVAEEENR